MKKIILTLTLAVSSLLTIAADIYVNGSGNANTYPTIQAAVNASSSGDNIYVATVGTYSEVVTVSNKSLFIMASIAGEEFTLSGSFTLSPGSGNEVTIIGMYNGNVTASGYGTVNLISSFISSISNNSGDIKMNVYDCEVTNSFVIDNGSVKGCTIRGGLNITNDPGATGDTIRIMGNYIEGGMDWSSQSAYFEICNNYIENVNTASSTQSIGIDVYYIQTSPGGTNLISNNTIKTYGNSSHNFLSNGFNSAYVIAGIRFYSTSNGQNLVIANNFLDVSNTYGNANYSPECAIFSNNQMRNALVANNYYNCNDFIYNFSNSSLIDNGSSSVSWTYSSSTGVISSQSAVNMGLDQIEYRDIDNTRNDIGTSGGPHAWSNYNTTNGKAAVFNLELPFQLYIGGNHNIKVKGFHKN